MKNDYKKLLLQIENEKKVTRNFCIGKTFLGKEITCFMIGENKNKTILLHGGIHAREYITSFFLIRLIGYLKHFKLDGRVLIVPLVNPDGVDICLNGSKNIKNERQKEFVENLLKGKNHLLYKANARGVDLNTNFDCLWGRGKQNINTPATENFVGFMPNSESEVKALIKLTDFFRPYLTLSYHSKGNVIFWGFLGQSNKTRLQEKVFLPIIERETKYKKVFTKNSAGGYKDFMLIKRDIVSFTIEVGSDDLCHPIGREYLDTIFFENKDVVLQILKLVGYDGKNKSRR